ncbi:MAG: hypothetical protein GEU28_02725 [Dehalococcoidia bacterium]|nr:hypothetical protein [Dehalococcoidia bacterium]
MPTFEQAFADVERAAELSAKAAADLVGVAKRLQKAATEGDIGRMQREADRLSETMRVVTQEVANTIESWPYSREDEEAYIRESYADELLTMAAGRGLQMRRQDANLVAFPSVIRLMPAERAIRIDKAKSAAVRPSSLVDRLRANQAKKSRFAGDKFIEALYRVYKLLTRGGEPTATVALASVYEGLTLLPGAAADYDMTDFARDLFLLDRNGPGQTRRGAKLSLPASTGTRGGRVLTFVAPDGEMVTYYGIRFLEAE